MRYALVPHAGDWREAGVYRDGLEFNHPLLCRKVLPHAGTMPARWGLLEVSSPNVVVSALKPGRDGTTVLRVYEATGRPAPGVKIAFKARVIEAGTANLLEDPEGALVVDDNAVSLDLRPYQIRTIRLKLGG
jgi:alpha-mannosidase